MTRPSPPASVALALATASGDVVLQALANLCLGFAYAAQGDYRRAIDCHRQTVVVLDGARRYERFGQVLLPAVHARALLVLCHAELGTFAEGSALGAEGLQIAEAVAHPASLMFAYYGIGLLAPAPRRPAPGHSPGSNGRWVSVSEADLPAYFPGWQRPWVRRTRWAGALPTPCHC